MTGPSAFTTGPMFRHERPSAVVIRQFHQLALGRWDFPAPKWDAELMLLAYQVLTQLGVRSVRVELNSLGIPAERHAHRAAR